MPILIDNVTDLNDAIETAQEEAQREAERTCPGKYIASRGRWWIMPTTGGEPRVASGMLEYRGSQNELARLISEAEMHPEVTELCIEGGFNVADNKRAYHDGDYEPWVSEWSVTVWERQKQPALKPYRVVIELYMAAKDKKEAEETGSNAIEHLRETFNDDDSIDGGKVIVVGEL